MRNVLPSVLIVVAVGCFAGCSGSSRRASISGWIADNAVAIKKLDGRTRDATTVERAFEGAQVVGLGEATHGQHESFEVKRAITNHLIVRHRFRIVAYEASASKAAACEAYVSGASDDLDAAMSGLGMMIWDIEENAALLRDLRAWNQRASPQDRVRFIGVDVQDMQACATRLAGLMTARWPDEAANVRSMSERLDGAVQQMFSGDRATYDELVREHMAFAERMNSMIAVASLNDQERKELRSGLRELEGAVHMYLTSGRRDRAMAEMLLAALADAGPDAKAVFWAHNGHITRSPMRYMRSDELAAGGHLARELGNRYYAVGFAFGKGEFVANDQADGKWIYRTYVVDEPPAGSLESWFTGINAASIIDLRSDSGDPDVERWKAGGHGQRWAGGYRVPPDVRESTRDVSTLLPTYPREGFDALVYLPTTTGSTPRPR